MQVSQFSPLAPARQFAVSGYTRCTVFVDSSIPLPAPYKGSKEDAIQGVCLAFPYADGRYCYEVVAYVPTQKTRQHIEDALDALIVEWEAHQLSSLHLQEA